MPTLRPAQAAAVPIIAFQPRLLLADVGAGKTATALRALRLRTITQGKHRTLVLGTKRICQSVWPGEVQTWAPEFRCWSAAGHVVEKRRRIMEDPSIDIVCLNFDNLMWAIKTYGEALADMFPYLIIDESSKLENPSSKSFKELKPLLPLFQWRLPMTGTPRANHLYDMWGSVYLADAGEALGQYREAFLQRWFFPVKRPAGLSWIPKANAEDEIYERIAGTVHRMPFKSPEPVEIDVQLPCNPTVAAIQKVIDEKLKAGELDVVINGVTYTHKGFRVNMKQLQLSAGMVYTDDGDVIHLHDDKLQALDEIIAEAKGEPTMVVFQFNHERDAILERFPQARLLDNTETLDAWNRGEIEMLLVHPLSCGHGLNAQFSQSSLQVWFTPTSDAELYTQTIGRLNRPGNPNTVRVMRLIMRGTKDMGAYLVIAARQRGEEATLDMFED